LKSGKKWAFFPTDGHKFRNDWNIMKSEIIFKKGSSA